MVCGWPEECDSYSLAISFMIRFLMRNCGLFVILTILAITYVETSSNSFAQDESRMPSIKNYAVMIEGKNFIMKFEGKKQKTGFFVKRAVQGTDEREAELKVMDLLRTELRESVLNKKDDPPMMYLEQIREISEEEAKNIPKTGFTFFTDEEENSKPAK